MESQDVNFRDLLAQIETALYDSQEVDAAAFLQSLQRARPAFLNLLRYKVCGTLSECRAGPQAACRA